MSTDRDVTSIVRSWLDEGVTALPDRVLDAVLDQVPATPQRRAWWPVRRLPTMNNTAKLTLAAAAVVAVALLGIRFLAPGTGTGGPGATPTPTPEPQALVDGAHGPGIFTTEFFSEDPANPVQFTFELPADWGAARPWVIGPDAEGDGAVIAFVQPNGIYSDPCLDNQGPSDVAVGSAAELASALTEHEAYAATATGEFSTNGYSGIRMELVMPSDLDYSTCEGGQFWVWEEPFFEESPAGWDLWILDVDGVTAVVLAEVASATPQEQDQIEQIVDSIQIQP